MGVKVMPDSIRVRSLLVLQYDRADGIIDLWIANDLILNFLRGVINEKIILDFDSFFHFFLYQPRPGRVDAQRKEGAKKHL